MPLEHPRFGKGFSIAMSNTPSGGDDGGRG